ncbi:MAG: RagB/SusD family nutrient uptake outer membrane protein, partial [Muribaculaceae bacterium]|nr:RagB/SusD family nutrient uptake outer membrane protein [Muribaculaceae bacterium]
AMEGHRWFDLVRWGVAVETMNEYYRSESEIRSYLAPASMSADEIYFPIPLAEVQNSGGLYEKK